MITFFTTGKPFRGHDGIIQRNALKSWTLLHPDVEVILFGDEGGAAEVCAEFGLRHEPHVMRYESRMPYVNAMFARAQEIARHDYVCYASRSTDRGSTWSDPVPLFAPEPAPRATHTVRVTRLRDGSLLGFGARFIRSDPNQGLINHPGLGYCECELITTRSRKLEATMFSA